EKGRHSMPVQSLKKNPVISIPLAVRLAYHAFGRKSGRQESPGNEIIPSLGDLALPNSRFSLRSE
ncbi:MAG: hypothetical protein KKB74_08330, partial [Bacteroidetes bacterium]|nr:hypothetical protein [Bacteroidota bacterium]